MKTEKFYSEQQIKNYFEPRLEGMNNREIRDWFKGYCSEHRVKCCGQEYTKEDMCNIFIERRGR